MKFCLNPEEYFKMFPVPLSVAREHLKLCSEMQLKALILHLSGEDIPEIANTLSLSESGVQDALSFWVQRSVLLNYQNKAVSHEKTSKSTSAIGSNVKIKEKPKAHEAAVRCSQDERLKTMMTEAQRMLGRLISPSEVSTMVWLHDDQGLDPAVILMAVQYAAVEGIKGFSYIENMCIGWVRDGVFTVQDAEKQLKKLFLQKSAWGIVESAFGIPHRKPTKKENEYSNIWINEWGFKKNMLETAYERCIDSTGKLSFGYINKILMKWHELDISEPEEIDDKEQMASKTKGKSVQRSYNVDKIKSKFNKFD